MRPQGLVVLLGGQASSVLERKLQTQGLLVYVVTGSEEHIFSGRWLFLFSLGRVCRNGVLPG